MKMIPLLDAPGSRLPGKPKNLELIDQFRGVAILLVLLCHVNMFTLGWDLPWVNDLRDFAAYGHRSPFIHLFYLGWAGVPLFFVLSGFCIHWSCMRWERFEIHRFLWQRFWRIYPLYLITLIIFSLTDLRGATPLFAANQILTHVFLVHNFWDSTLFGINGPTWSLAVEVQLYLLYPLLLVLKQRMGWRGCFLVAGLVSLSWRLITVAIWGLPSDGAGMPTMASPLWTWPDWMLGAWIAERYAIGRRAFPDNRMLPLVTLVCFVISTIYRPLIMFSFFLASLTTAICLDQMLHREPALQPRSRVSSYLGKGIAWFGLISYSLYLWHLPIMQHCYNLIEKSVGHVLPKAIWAPPTAILSVLLATLVAYFSFRFFEKPGIQLGRTLLTHLSDLKATPAALCAPQINVAQVE
jgi:peptidoglycan/LPS O-acetylase OafA/YrhL